MTVLLNKDDATPERQEVLNMAGMRIVTHPLIPHNRFLLVTEEQANQLLGALNAVEAAIDGLRDIGAIDGKQG